MNSIFYLKFISNFQVKRPQLNVICISIDYNKEILINYSIYDLFS